MTNRTALPPNVQTSTPLDLLRAKREAAWWRVVAADIQVFENTKLADVLEEVVKAAILDDQRKRFEAKKAHALECNEAYRAELREAFATFRSLDAQVIARGGLPAEIDQAADEWEWPMRIVEAARRAFPDAYQAREVEEAGEEH